MRSQLEHIRDWRGLPVLPLSMACNAMSALPSLVAASRVVRQLMGVSASKSLSEAEQEVGCYPAFANIRRIESMKSVS